MTSNDISMVIMMSFLILLVVITDPRVMHKLLNPPMPKTRRVRRLNNYASSRR